MTDQMGTATIIETKKNVEKEQEDMEFSSSIQDVMSAPIDAPPMSTNEAAAMMVHPALAPEKKSSSASSGYPLNLSKAQVESLVAGVAAVIGVSGPVQEKLSDIIPNFFNELGKLSTTGMAVTVLVVAVVFYFLRQFVIGKK